MKSLKEYNWDSGPLLWMVAFIIVGSLKLYFGV